MSHTDISETPSWNDAYVYGELESPDAQAVLAQRIAILSAKGANNRQMRRVPGTVHELIDGTLSRHKVAHSKDGDAIVFADSIPPKNPKTEKITEHGHEHVFRLHDRKSESIKSICFAGYDVDGGESLDNVIDRLQELGFFAIVYTTHSHGKNRSEIPQSAIDGEPADEAVLAAAQDMGLANPDIIKLEAETKDGKSCAIVRHDPVDKFRILLPLEEPFQLAPGDRAEHNRLCDEWKGRLIGFANERLGIEIDETGCDVNRLFYTPRHPHGAADWHVGIIAGRALTVDEMPLCESNRPRQGQPRAVNGNRAVTGKPDGECPFLSDGFNLSHWVMKFGDRFLVTDFLNVHDWDVRGCGAGGDGAVIECPNDAAHSNPGVPTDPACFVKDGDGDNKFLFTCHHNNCKGLGKLEMLVALEGQVSLPDDVEHMSELLCSDHFYMDAPDGETHAPVRADFLPTPEENAGQSGKPPLTRSDLDTPEKIIGAVQDAGLNKFSSSADIEAFQKRVFDGGVDDALANRVRDELVRATSASKPDLKAHWKTLTRDQQREQRTTGNNPGNTPDVTAANFGDMCEYARTEILEANSTDPFLFHYMERAAIVRANESGHVRIKMLDKYGLSHAIDKVAKFKKPLGDKASVQVSPPWDVVGNVWSSDYSELFLPLVGVVESPFFDAKGQLIRDAGYHRESKVFLSLSPDLVVPAVSEAPSEDEVFESKRLLIEEVLADFPLGAKTRPEIVDEGLRRAGIPAVTNAIGMILLPFMREMVDGPTPGHLLTKPVPGTGASLLTDACSIIMTGEVSPAIALPRSKEEIAKTLTTVFYDGSNIVYFDNIPDEMDSSELASAMTAPVYKARILGRSQSVEASVRCVWIFTGNNVTMSSELLRRMTMIELDARVANPELRSGFRHSDIRAWVTANRGLLVWACLTLIQNWIARGKETETNVALASFENWARVIGGVLKSAVLGGFMGNRDDLRDIASSDKDDAVRMLVAELAGYPEDTIFRPASDAQIASQRSTKVVSIMNVLNNGCEATGNKPILIDGWGYNMRDPEAYAHGGRIGRHFRELARRAWIVADENGCDVEVRFVEHTDTRNRVPYYSMSKKLADDAETGSGPTDL